MTRIKICCITSAQEARTAVAQGADAVGLVSAMPSGPGVIRESEIAAIARTVPPPVASFLLTSHTSAADIVAQQRACGAGVLQLCDRVDDGELARLRAALPGIGLVQVVHVVDESSVAEASAVCERVDALLLDSGRPDGPRRELGGTGRVHDWSLSARIAAEAAKPVFLAGGLDPGNVAEAIARVGPFGVDVCSGVRSDDRLDPEKLRAFVAEVRRADANPDPERSR